MRIKYLIATTILSLIQAGCSNNTNALLPKHYFCEIYVSAQQKLQDGNYKNAIKALETLEKEYPFGHYLQKVQLYLIYAYYQVADWSLAQDSINRFLRFNPTHQHVDYVLYMRGLTDMALDNNALQAFFGIDRYDRNQKNAYAAFLNFKKLLSDYPHSQYAVDVTKHLMSLKERLAKHELSIVEYYYKRGAYVAVANRVEKMLRDFPDTRMTRRALPYMANAYRKLKLNDQADQVTKIIAENIAKN